MHIRCPHCHNAIEVVEDSSFRDVSCPSCGSHFNLVGGDTPTETGPTTPRRVGHFELVEQLGVGLYLQDSRIAAEMLRDEPILGDTGFDLIERTMFIEWFPKWPGDIENLVDVVRNTREADLKSGISLAIGSIERPTVAGRKAWETIFVEWHRSETDSGIHGATDWTLRSWGGAPSTIVRNDQKRRVLDWQVTKTGLTMIRIPAGEIKVTEKGKSEGARRRVRIPGEYWLSDREVTAGQYLDILGVL